MTDPIRRLVMQHGDMGKIEEAARAEGMRTMYEDGLVKALQGHDDDRGSAARDAGKLMALYRYKAVTPPAKSSKDRSTSPPTTRPSPSSRTRATFRSKCAKRPTAPRGGSLGLLRRSAMGAEQVLQFTQQLACCSAPDSRSIARCRFCWSCRKARRPDASSNASATPCAAARRCRKVSKRNRACSRGCT